MINHQLANGILFIQYAGCDWYTPHLPGIEGKIESAWSVTVGVWRVYTSVGVYEVDLRGDTVKVTCVDCAGCA